MVWPRNSSDEPLTPVGRTFFHHGSGQVVHLAVGMKHRIEAQELKEAIMKDSVMVNHPRFCSLMVRDGRGVEHWRRTHIDIDRHVIVVNDPVGSGHHDDEAAVNEYVADLSLLTEMDYGKPLWEIHVLNSHNCMIMRIHHSLGDGVSLISMLTSMCRQVDHSDSIPTMTSSTRRNLSNRRSSSWYHAVTTLARRVSVTFVFILGFIFRFLRVRERKRPINGGNGVDLWPKKLATVRFLLDDMNLVKTVVPGATINDVLTGVISLGLCRYLDTKHPGSVQGGLTGLVMVNLRKQPGLHELTTLMTGDPSLRWGNLIGLMVLPFPMYNDRNDHKNRNNPLSHVIAAKAMLDRKKISYVAAFSFWLMSLTMSCFGGKVVGYFGKMLACNTTFVISNMVGPKERISYLGNPITYIKASVTSSPHSLAMHMVSYAGRADLQVMVAKDIIPDPEFLVECFEGALREVKAAVEDAITSRNE